MKRVFITKIAMPAIKSFLMPIGSRERLGISRFVFFLGVFFLYMRSRFNSFNIPPESLWSDHSFYTYLPWNFRSFQTLYWAEMICRGTIILSALGILTPVFITLSFLLSLFILGLPIGFIPSDFQYQILVLTMGVLALSRSGDGFSVDQLIRKKFFKKDDKLPQEHHEYGWPYKLILLLLATMYFKAGVAKLRISEFRWLTDEILASNISFTRTHYQHSIPEWTNLVYDFLVNSQSSFAALSIAVILLELPSIIPFFWPRFLNLFMLIWLSFHFGVFVLMGIWSSIWLLPVFAFLIPWDKIFKVTKSWS